MLAVFPFSHRSAQAARDLRQANEILISDGSLKLAISFFVKVDRAASQRDGRKKLQRRRAGPECPGVSLSFK